MASLKCVFWVNGISLKQNVVFRMFWFTFERSQIVKVKVNAPLIVFTISTILSFQSLTSLQKLNLRQCELSASSLQIFLENVLTEDNNLQQLKSLSLGEESILIGRWQISQLKTIFEKIN